jgi:exosortase A
VRLEKSVEGPRDAAQAIASVMPRGPLAVVAALVTLTLILFWPTTASLLEEWNDTAALTYTHGYLIAAICVWLLFRERMALATIEPRPDYRAALALALASVAWLVAYRAGLQLIHQVLMPLIAWLAVCAALGAAAAKRCAFPIGFLYFAIPLWSQGNWLLQDTTVLAVRMLFGLTSIPVHFVDNVVHIPAGVFEIVGGCSGLHFFIVAVALAALYGELNRDPLKVRLFLIALAVVIAMVSNWLRVFTIIVAGHLTDMQHFLIQVDHYYFGWFVFAIAMALFFTIARRLPLASLQTEIEQTPMPSRVKLSGVAAALAAMIVGPAWSLLAAASESTAASAIFPIDPGDWRGPFSASNRWQPYYPGADAEQRVEYRDAAHSVTVYVATYARQRQGKELIGYENSILGKSSDSVASTALLPELTIKELEVSGSDSGASLVWYRYRIGSRAFARDITTQLYYGAASLVSRPASRIIGMRTECVPDCVQARSRLADLLQELSKQSEAGL